VPADTSSRRPASARSCTRSRPSLPASPSSARASPTGSGGSSARRPPDEPFPELTHREREILDLIARGASNHEIATRFTLSEKTVRNYVSTILTKLQVAHRAQAIVRAREAGLGLG
jgi:DNA-binding NarL/FixJ family response regulator